MIVACFPRPVHRYFWISRQKSFFRDFLPQAANMHIPSLEHLLSRLANVQAWPSLSFNSQTCNARGLMEKSENIIRIPWREFHCSTKLLVQGSCQVTITPPVSTGAVLENFSPASAKLILRDAVLQLRVSPDVFVPL